MSILCLAIQVAFVVSIIAVVYYFRLYKLHGISVKEWKEMQEDNFLMRELLDNLPIPATVKDIKNDCNYLFWNKKSQELYGVSQDDLIGKNASALSPEVYAAFRQTDDEAIRSGRSDTTQRLVLSDGCEHVLSMHKQLLYYKGEPRWLISAAMDITELQKTKEKAEEANKLKSAFLANISHEIRTPLNAIVGFSSIMAQTEGIAEKEEYNHLIHNNNMLLLKLVDDILDISKIEAGHIDLYPTWFCLSDLVAESAANCRAKGEGKLEVRVDKPEQDYLVELDAQRVKQILDNFLSNSLKNTQSGCIDIAYDVTEKGIKISVTDTGCGIPQDKQSVIFERFEKVNSFMQGVGLGLPICKSIAESMGGTIGLTSEVGAGSTFWVSLPCCTAPAPKLVYESRQSTTSIPNPVSSPSNP